MGCLIEWRKWRNEAKTGLSLTKGSLTTLNPKNRHLRHSRHSAVEARATNINAIEVNHAK